MIVQGTSAKTPRVFCDECDALIPGVPLRCQGKVFCSDGCRDEWKDAQQDAAIWAQERGRMITEGEDYLD